MSVVPKLTNHALWEVKHWFSILQTSLSLLFQRSKHHDPLGMVQDMGVESGINDEDSVFSNTDYSAFIYYTFSLLSSISFQQKFNSYEI